MRFNLTPVQKLSIGRMVVTKKLPYFATAMRSLIPIEYAPIKTMAVTEDAKLLWAPEFVDKLGPEDAGFVLGHELLHVLFDHVKDTIKMGIAPNTLWANVANVAQDLSINCIMRDAEFKMPQGDIAPLMPEMFGLEDGLGWVEYFNLLRDQINQREKDLAKKLQELLDQQAGGGQGRGAPMPGQGDCGSATGNPHPNEPQKADGQGQGQGDGEGEGDKPGTGRAVKGGGDGSEPGQGGNGNDPSDPDHPNNIPGRSKRDLARIRREAAKTVQNAGKSAGNMPGGFRRWADDVVTPPKIPWEVELAREFRSAVTYVGNGTHPTYDRVGSLQPIFGFGVGCPVLPVYRRPVPNVTLVIDTSGSMADKQISDSISEVAGVIRALGGGKLTFISGDCGIAEVAEISTLAEAKKHIAGGGGTDFRPPFRWAMKQPKNKRPDIIIYCTDGMGPAPEEAPPGIKTIWVLVGPHRTAPATWGKVIDLEIQ